ncbi:MAG: GerMN domain-containing protein [Spirochaetaceae bacterium]|jgi:hypothetical protein|nr:GerMN domain-containing protein [Spirochaetaceae bacterium]
MNMGVHGTGKNNSNRRRKLPAGILFWMVFFIIILFLFIVNMPTIRKTLQSTRLVERLTNMPVEVGEESLPDAEPPISVITVSPPVETYPELTDVLPELSAPDEDADTPENEPAPEVEALPPPEAAMPPPAEVAALEENAPETRERVIYFVKIDSSGLVFTSPVRRRVPVSDSPLIDALNLLLRGPTEAEQKQGLTSLIPEGVRIQNARVAGNTAVISFNENFMFNSYGAEGYIAQLRQIIWTATEFPNVYDVQILIEGRRVDFLGESIRIGRPIGRDSL